MGSDPFSLPILRALLERGPNLDEAAQIVGVVTQPDRPAGRGRAVSANSVKRLALEFDAPVLQPERVRDKDSISAISELEPDLIVVAAYGQILSRVLLDIPPRRNLNLHPSLLPLHRGPSPVAGSILAGDEITGTSLMVVSPRMDAGPVVAQARTEIEVEETAGELEARLSAMSAELLLQSLPAWLCGEAASVPQDEARATYTSRFSKADGRLDWNLPAEDLVRRIRAFNPWPVAHSQWDRNPIRLYRAVVAAGEGEPGTVLAVNGEGLTVAAGNGAVLVTELQLPGGKRLAAADALRGHPELRNAHLV
jgi:methionyl-tRNA formyltransferase